jgi:hypothetical protein
MYILKLLLLILFVPLCAEVKMVQVPDVQKELLYPIGTKIGFTLRNRGNKPLYLAFKNGEITAQPDKYSELFFVPQKGIIAFELNTFHPTKLAIWAGKAPEFKKDIFNSKNESQAEYLYTFKPRKTIYTVWERNQLLPEEEKYSLKKFYLGNNVKQQDIIPLKHP